MDDPIDGANARRRRQVPMLSAGAKRRYRRNILDGLVRRIGEGDRRSDVHAFNRDPGVSDEQALFVAQNSRHMVGSGHLAHEAKFASVDDGSQFCGDRGFLAQGAHCLFDLPQAWDCVEAGDQNPLGRGKQRKRP